MEAHGVADAAIRSPTLARPRRRFDECLDLDLVHPAQAIGVALSLAPRGRDRKPMARGRQVDRRTPPRHDGKHHGNGSEDIPRRRCLLHGGQSAGSRTADGISPRAVRRSRGWFNERYRSFWSPFRSCECARRRHRHPWPRQDLYCRPPDAWTRPAVHAEANFGVSLPDGAALNRGEWRAPESGERPAIRIVRPRYRPADPPSDA